MYRNPVDVISWTSTEKRCVAAVAGGGVKPLRVGVKPLRVRAQGEEVVGAASRCQTMGRCIAGMVMRCDVPMMVRATR